MEIEQMIAVAIATFFVIVIGYAVFFGSNVPFLLAARQKAIKELDKIVVEDLKVFHKNSNFANSFSTFLILPLFIVPSFLAVVFYNDITKASMTFFLSFVIGNVMSLG